MDTALSPVPRAPASVLRDYFHAKDENRPHRLDGVFAPQARLAVITAATPSRSRPKPSGASPSAR